MKALHVVGASALIGGLVCLVFVAKANAAETRTPFQINKIGGCQDESNCKIDPLRTAPEGSRLEVEHVSCHYATYPPATRVLTAGIIVKSATGQDVYRENLTTVLAVTADYAYTDSNLQTFFYIPSGAKAIAYLTVPNATDIRFNCSISGHKVTPD